MQTIAKLLITNGSGVPSKADLQNLPKLPQKPLTRHLSHWMRTPRYVPSAEGPTIQITKREPDLKKDTCLPNQIDKE